MKLSNATPEERAALAKMVAASAKLIASIGIAIKFGTFSPIQFDKPAEEFVDAIIEVPEASE